MFGKKAVLILLGLMILASPVSAAGVPVGVKASLDKAGIKLYPGAVYCTGQVDMGARFATSDSPEKVRKWYREQYPEWSLQEKYYSWAFYDGPPDQGMAVIMGTRNMVVQFNKELPGWHSLSKDMTTEILIAAPQ
jgi:hypothetical protein